MPRAGYGWAPPWRFSTAIRTTGAGRRSRRCLWQAKLDRAMLNVVYLPKVSEINEVATLGFWATWWLR
jgi:hypothetical protein